jgi:hypothetical protein
LVRSLSGLADAGGRNGFSRSLRAVIDWRGQHTCALDVIDAFHGLPVLMLWGTNDRMIPIEHGHAVLERLPAARLVALEGVGHVPHVVQPAYVAERLSEFFGVGSGHDGEVGMAPFTVLHRAGLTSRSVDRVAPIVAGLRPRPGVRMGH